MAGRKTGVVALKFVLWAGALAPATWIVAGSFLGWLGVNPIEKVTHVTGMTTLVLLLVTLSVTPFRRVTGWHPVIGLRRPLGLFAFFYASVHFLIWIALDLGFRMDWVWDDIRERPYITVGFAAFLTLIPLAITSTKGWIRRLGRRWGTLHRLVYVAASLGALHFYWLVKADVRLPLLLAGILMILLAARVPGWLSQRRRRQATVRAPATSRTVLALSLAAFGSTVPGGLGAQGAEERIIVSGASGQLGGLVVERLLALGVAPARLILVSRTPEELAGYDRESGVAWTMLPYQLYMDGILGQATRMIAAGQVVVPPGAARTAYATREDCAFAAAAVLATPGHENRIYEITGSEPIGPRGIAQIASEITGRPIEVVEGGVTPGGGPPAGSLATVSTAVADLTGRSPTTARAFLEANRDALLGAVPP
ncbi:MAG: ferric reductase-like transmembrane domain-containing protein [Gemmatimonadota bacterium]